MGGGRNFFGRGGGLSTKFGERKKERVKKQTLEGRVPIKGKNWEGEREKILGAEGTL